MGSLYGSKNKSFDTPNPEVPEFSERITQYDLQPTISREGPGHNDL